MFGKFGTVEILLILAVALLIFGPPSCRSWARPLGRPLETLSGAAPPREKAEEKHDSKES